MVPSDVFNGGVAGSTKGVARCEALDYFFLPGEYDKHILFFILYIEILSHVYVHNQSQQILADSHSDRNSV